MKDQMDVAGCSATGVVRSHNGDAFLAADLTRGESSSWPRWSGGMALGSRGALLAVADGRGEEGDVASSLVVSSLAEALASEDECGSSRERLTSAPGRLAWTQTCRQGIDMGATVAAAYVRGRAVSIVELGESRAYLIRGRSIHRMPRLARCAPREDMILFRNVVLQAVGSGSEAAVFTSGCELRDGDHLLLCSDGLSEEVPESTMRDVVLGAVCPEVAAQQLVDMAHEGGGWDNVTVLLARFLSERGARRSWDRGPRWTRVTPRRHFPSP